MERSNDVLHAQVSLALDAIVESASLPIPGTRLVMAVSGGPDSLALLHALRHLIPNDELLVAHFDHQLRPESAADAAFVRDLADRWGLAFVGGSADVAALSERDHLGIEEAARLARYRFLAETARKANAAAIVTGHNAADQAETVLMHILRGSGLAGLRGMATSAALPNNPDLWLLRPFLQTSRDDIEQYCRDNGLESLVDATNADPTFLRNRLRHELLPLLRTYNLQINERLQQLSAVAAADFDLVDDLTNAALADLTQNVGESLVMLDRPAWLDLPLSLRRGTLRAALRQLLPDQRDMGFAALEAARLAAELPRSGQQAHLPGGAVLHVTADRLLLTKDGNFPTSLALQMPDEQPMKLTIPGRVQLAGGQFISAEIVPKPRLSGMTIGRDPWEVQVALPPNAELIVRGRLSGERMQPLGLGGHSRSLKQIMIDRKIPAPLRARWPIVVADGQVIWLTGYALDHRYRVIETSDTIVRLRCE